MAQHHPVETKVKASGLAAFGISAGALAILSAVQEQPGLVAGLPDVIEPLVLALVPGAAAYVAGWFARHTPRP